MKKILGLFATLITLTSCSGLNSFIPVAETHKAKTFTPAWIKVIDPTYETGNLPIALQSPLIFEGLVYTGENSGFMKAYELENGRQVWSEYDGSSYHSAPVSYKDQIIYGTVQGRVISRHYTTGKLKYSVDLGASVETKGTIYQGRLFYQLRNHQVFCLDVETGKILWGYKRSVSYLTTLQRASAPVVYKDKVLVGLADGTLVALSVDEGVLLYESKITTALKFVDVDNTPFILDDKVYIGPVGAPITQLDANTGRVLHRGDFIASRAPYLDPQNKSDQLLFGTPTGELILSDKNLVVQKKMKISNGAISSIVPFKQGVAISTTAGEIFQVDPRTLLILDKFSLGHAYSAVFGEMDSSEKHSSGQSKQKESSYLTVLSSRNRLFTFH